MNVREAFQNIVRELSEKGVSIMHNEENRSDGGVGGGGEVSGNINVNIEDIDMRMERGDTQDSGRPRKPGEEQRSLGVLLQLWVSSLAATELLPAVAVSAFHSQLIYYM